MTKVTQSVTYILITPLLIFILGCSLGATSKDEIPEISTGYVIDEAFQPSPPTSRSAEISLMSNSVETQNTPIVGNYNSAEIHTGSLTVEVNSVTDNLNKIENLIDQEQGYIEHLNSYGTDYNQSANLTVRVPHERFKYVISNLQTLGIVLNKSIGSEDVSEQLIDLNARLKSYTREENNLLKLLDNSETISDIIAIERELSRIRSEIESLQGKLKYYDGKITMSTININLVTAYANNTSPPYGLIELITSSPRNNMEQIKTLVENDGGKVDYISSDYSNSVQSLELTVIIKRGSFPTIFKSIENLGTVHNKYTNEPQNANKKIDAKIDSRITVTLRESRYLTPNAQISAAIVLFISITATAIWLVTRRTRS